jgi:protease-4
MVDVHGILAKRYTSSSIFSSGPTPDPVSDLKEALNRAAGDADVKALVLRIDSPGGVVSWCDAMHQEIARFRKKTEKPVVACITGLGASGGYYIALAADKICAAPAAAVGSIGVIAIFLNLEELAGKIGVETQVIKSGAKKDMGGLWRGMEADEKAIAQAMIDEYYGRFVDLVLESRPGLTRAKLKPLADGRLFTAKQALENGLVDELVYLDQAINLAKEAAGLEDAALVTYARSHQYVNNIYSQAPNVNVINVDLHSVTGALPAGFYFLWQPGG